MRTIDNSIIYKNKRTGKKWFLISSVLIGGVYTGYINYYLQDENKKTITIPDYKFEKFYIKQED